MDSTRRPVTSVDVSPDTRAVLRPLGTGDVRITEGFWAGRQRTNREISLIEAVEHLERSGNFENLRLAAGHATGPYRTPAQQLLPFMDSDVYKWLEAVGWELGRQPSEQLSRLADDAIALVAAAQCDDGYLNSYYQVVEPEARWQNLAWGHELYCAGHLIQAAVAHTRARGDEALLRVARGVADRVAADFGQDRRHGVGGHPEIEMALVELFRLTGERRYLRLAAYFVDERGRGLAGPHHFGPTYVQDHQPVRAATTVTGHAVRQLYLAAGATDLSMERDDGELLEALVRQWESMVATKMYLTAGVGSRHADEAFGDPYELPPDRAYNETCAAIASIMWAWRLLLATGQARYADLIERTLYNGFAPGVSLDGRRYFYVNRLHARVDPDLADGTAVQRHPWFGCACCPPNVMRLLSSLEHYIATHTAAGVQVHQYTSCSVSVPRTDGAVELRIETGYPWDGRVTVHVTATTGGAWELALRVPAWCDDAVLEHDGDGEQRAGMAGGYLAVTRQWRAGDRAVLTLPTPPRLTEPHPYVDAVRGCVAIERGPLVYCLESTDLPDGVDLADTSIAAGATLHERHQPSLLGGIVTVHADATVHGPQDRRASPYRTVGSDGAAPTTTIPLQAIPYYAWANRDAGPMRVWVPRT